MFKNLIEKYESSISTLGNMLEWYSFALFMPFLSVLSKQFFPSEMGALSEVLSLLAFSSGLFIRPLGAAILGPIGDKLGRQKALSISVLLMALPTFCIGLLPTYGQIGILSPILLVLFRLLQGISLGGEFAIAMVHLFERAPPNRRAFYACFAEASSDVGVLLAAQSLVLLYSLFSNEEVYSFAWRIPFLLSALLIPFSFLTPNVPEKKESQESKTSEEPYLKALITYKKEVLYIIMIMSLCAVGFYTLLAFLPYYLVHINALSPKEAATCSSCASFFCITFTLLGGYLSDLFNNKKFFLRAGAVGVTSVTCFIFLCGASSFPQWLIIQILYGISIGLFYSTRNSFFSAAFPKRVRCAAVALSINIAQAIFGGLIPVVLNYATRVSPFLSIMPALLAGISTLWALSVLKELKEGK